MIGKRKRLLSYIKVKMFKISRLSKENWNQRMISLMKKKQSKKDPK